MHSGHLIFQVFVDLSALSAFGASNSKRNPNKIYADFFKLWLLDFFGLASNGSLNVEYHELSWFLQKICFCVDHVSRDKHELEIKMTPSRCQTKENLFSPSGAVKKNLKGYL